jgi:hypothetical protein
MTKIRNLRMRARDGARSPMMDLPVFLREIPLKRQAMLKTILMSLFLTLGSSQVMAEWVKISHNEQSVFYIETPIPKKVGSSVMIWVLRDHTGLRQGPSGPYLSSKDQIEVDCAGRRIRRMYSSDHPQAMGAGKLVNSEHGPMSWNYASPNTIASRMVDVACR